MAEERSVLVRSTFEERWMGRWQADCEGDAMYRRVCLVAVRLCFAKRDSKKKWQ